MHKYLRAVGFSKIRKKSELKKILNKVLKEPTTKEYVSLNDESIAVEYKKEFTDSLGIVVCGEYSDDVEFEFEYYYPYFTGSNISSNEEISFEEPALELTTLSAPCQLPTNPVYSEEKPAVEVAPSIAEQSSNAYSGNALRVDARKDDK